MGRHPVHTPDGSPRGNSPRWRDPYFNEWSQVVGERIRRLRRERELNLAHFSGLIYKPEGGHYSGGYFSRLERGWSSAPLYVYLAVSEALAVHPGRLLGADDVQKDASDAEMTLVRFLRRVEISPDEAIARLALALPRHQQPPAAE